MSSSAAWSGTATNPGLLALGVVVLIGAVAAGATGSTVMMIPIAVVGILLATWSRLRMDVTSEEVRVHWGHLGFPVNRVRVADIVGVEAVAIRPAHAGGWGYRGSRRLFRSAAALVRRGPAIKLHLERGRAFIVTVDDAATGATVLQELTEGSR